MPPGPLWSSGHHFERTRSLLCIVVAVAFLIKSALHFSEVIVARSVNQYWDCSIISMCLVESLVVVLNHLGSCLIS